MTPPLRPQNPFLLVLLVVSLLGLLSLLRPGPTVGGVALRPVRLLADVLRPAPAATAALALPPPNGRVTPAKGGPATPAAPVPAADSVAPNPEGLTSFLAALRRTKATGSQTRIAYFGDSMIEADILTSDLRDLLQTEFGGAGVGFVPINSAAAAYRETVRSTASADWEEFNLVSAQRPAAYPLGVSGQAFVPHRAAAADSPDLSWVRFQAGHQFAGTRRFAGARLFYGPSPGSDQVLLTANGQRTTYPLAGTAALNELSITADAPTQQLQLAFATHGLRPVYGVSFESPGGVVLDNFSFRGNSGMALLRIPPAQLAAFGKVLNYQLIILHYGVNIADTRNKNYVFYEEALLPVVAHMKRAFPQASILVVGMSDKSIRRDGEFITDPTVPLLVAAQRRLAERTHVAFWDLFAAMGGPNTMTDWVENQTPPLGRKDYMHLTGLGGNRIARLLYAHFMAAYAQPAPAAPLATRAAPTPPARPQH